MAARKDYPTSPDDTPGHDGKLPADLTALLPSDLEAPLLLLAMPQILDPFFNMSVVLLVRHEEEGSQGYIINRPTAVPVGEIMTGLDLEWSGDDDLAAYFGGPVQPQLGTVLYRDAEPTESSSQVEVLPKIHMSQNIRDLERLAAEPPGAFRLFLGHAGWGEGQLMSEIERNDWLLAPASEELVFKVEATSIWATALRSVGIDPSQLPRWAPGDDAPAN